MSITFYEALQAARDGKNIRHTEDPIVYFRFSEKEGKYRVLETRGVDTGTIWGHPHIMEWMFTAEWEIE
jgi:hypothetical protein